MLIEYDVSEEDYINFNLFHYYHSKNAKRTTRAIFGIVFIATFVVLFMIDFRERATISPSMWYWVFTLALVLVCIIWMRKRSRLYEYMFKKNIRRHINEGRDNDFIGHQKLTLKDDCIEAVSRLSTGTTQYSAVERIGFGYNCIFIYIGAIKAYVVPVSAFSNENQKNEFIEILKSKAGLRDFKDDVIY